MKRLNSILVIILLLSFAACKKNSGAVMEPPPGNPNDEFKATVSIPGGSAVTINAHGNSTIFGRTIYSNGDTTLSIAGFNDDLPASRSVQILLGNISAVGTYKFIPELTPGSAMYSYCNYAVGSGFSYSEYYTTNEHDSTSTITITELTATHIAGSIASVTCGNTEKEIQITNVTFKGDFMK